MSTLEADYDRLPSAMGGSETAWTVEARSTTFPKAVSKQIFDAQWRRVHFDRQQWSGVPVCAPHARYTADAEMYSYPSAQALRWWIHAYLEARHDNLCFETRLVKHIIKHSVSNTPESYHAVVGGDDRSGFMPEDKP